MASAAKDDSGIYHLTVGTEVSAKYRGAFCEAQIKSLKKSLVYKVVGKKTGKSFHLSEDNIKGVLKIGAVVELQVPDQTLWQEGTIQSVKDRSSYTVVFDDGDERTLYRGSLCLKGDRHYAKSETLDNLPLTDPENFGTPVLGSKKNRRRRPADEEFEGESEDLKTPDRETPKTKEKRQLSEREAETSSEDDEDDDEKRTRWLADPLMGKVVIVEPYDKRKHWFPGLVVNPLCYERHKDLSSGSLVVRSFKTGKFLRVSRASVKEMSNATIPPKLDSVWKGIVEDAQKWQKTRTVSDRWRIDIKEILDDSEDEDYEKSDGELKRKGKEDKILSTESEDDSEKEELGKKNDFLEVLYKFMDDCGTPINKTPVLGYKDLNLYLLFKLVQKRQGSFSIDSIKEWKQIYLDLGIPKPNPAAGHNVRTAYLKYLGAYEEYCASWKHVPLLKKSPNTKSPNAAGNKEKKKFKADRSTKASQDGRKIKTKDKSRDINAESKLKGRSSPLSALPSMDSPTVGQQRRSYQRRRISESSSASDVTLPPSNSKAEKKKPAKGNQMKRADEKFRSPGGPDSEPDENSRTIKTEKKESGEKRHAPKSSAESAAAKRIRRNSTSSVSTQYSIADKLKVKYGQGKTFKLYDAKVLQVKPPEGPGESIEYLVHYAGWNARHDEWIRPVRIVGFAEDKGSVPLSPAPGTTKQSARRPRTPVSSRTSSVSKDEIIPSPGPSYSISSRFSSIEDDLPGLKDDLPDLTVKPARLPSVLKKNLVGDFMKSLSSSTMTSSTKRPTSPVLVSSQRTKRPRTPPVSMEPTPTPIKPPLQTRTKQEPPAPKVETPPSVEKQDKSNEKKVKPEEEPPSRDEKVIHPPPKVESKPEIEEKPAPEERERSVSPSEESLSSSIGEASEDNANEQRVGTPLQQVRRTSRRSKSPAYLIESSWFSTKRKKYSNASVEKSPSPSPTSEKKENPPKQESLDDSSSATGDAQRTSSPTSSSHSQSSSSSSPSSSEVNPQSKESSPVLSNLPKMTKTRMQARKKLQDKVESGPAQQEEKMALDKEKQKPESTEATEYDNFDDEAPSIALEKHHEIEDSTTKPPNEIAEQPSEGGISCSPGEKELTPQVDADAPTKPEKTTRKKNETSEKSTGRKIRKRKLTTGDAEAPPTEKTESKVSDVPEIADAEGDIPPVQHNDTTDTAKAENENEKSVPEETSQSQDASNKNEGSEIENTSETTSPSNHDNSAEASHIQSLPQNPPSSSKVLIENTPPTTPEQSPNYISEDQDIDQEKSSPNLYSDAMDIVEGEHKDSAGNTSSSGCEQVASSDKHNQPQEVESKTDNAEEIAGPPAKKKRRDVSRKGSTSKSRGSRHSSYANDQDSESDDDQDNETGETTRRKRRESTGRGKPRRKRTKARPEPPSAPPPLPREELESMSQDERIAFLQTRMAEMRKVYHQLKQEVANIDRKRKRAKRREKEAAEAAQSSSKRGSSPFALGKFAYPATTKAEASTAPLASNVNGGQQGTERDVKSEDGR